VAVEGTWGAEFYHGIRPGPGEIVITKHRYGGFTGTDLEIILGSLGAKTLVLTGVATNVCVESTAREGFMLDYDIVVVSDCCATVGRELHEGTLENIRLNFGRVASADEVVAAWSAAVASPQGKGGEGGSR
jgi:ureidoacrylate peracid hydrolase